MVSQARGQTIALSEVVRQGERIGISWLVQVALGEHIYLLHKQSTSENRPIQLIR